MLNLKLGTTTASQSKPSTASREHFWPSSPMLQAAGIGQGRSRLARMVPRRCRPDAWQASEPSWSSAGSREGAQILAVERQRVEGVELHLVIMLPRVQGVEVGNTIDAEDNGLAVNDELLLAVLQRGLDDPGIALGPVVSVAGYQAHAVT